MTKSEAIKAMREALHEATRFLTYFAEGDTYFVGTGTPKSCLKQVQKALAAFNAAQPDPPQDEIEAVAEELRSLVKIEIGADRNSSGMAIYDTSEDKCELLEGDFATPDEAAKAIVLYRAKRVVARLRALDAAKRSELAQQLTALFAGYDRVPEIPEPPRYYLCKTDYEKDIMTFLFENRATILAALRSAPSPLPDDAVVLEALSLIRVVRRDSIVIGPIETEGFAHIRMTSDHWHIADTWMALRNSALTAIRARKT